MASAAYELTTKPATLEADSTGAVITNGKTIYEAGKPELAVHRKHRSTFMGQLINHGPADVWLKISCDIDTPATAAGVATTGAQAVDQVPLPAGSTLDVLTKYFTIAHKTAAGTATLSWRPKG